MLGTTNGYTSQDGTKPLYLRVSNPKKKYYPLGLRAEPSQWNAKQQILKANYMGAADLNQKFFKIVGDVKSTLSADKHADIPSIINTILYDAKIHSPEHLFVPYINTFIIRCEEGKILSKKNKQKISSGHIALFRTMRKHVEAFEVNEDTKFTFNDITEEWHNAFVTFLRHTYKCKITNDEDGEKITGLSENSITCDIKKIQRVLKQAKKEGLNKNLEYEDFVANWQDSDNIALTKDEVKAILDLDLTDHPRLVPEQDRVSLAYNFLLRFSDSMKVNPKHIFMDEGQPFFKMVTGKTTTEVIIPVTPRNYQILQRDGFKLKSANITAIEKLQALGKMAGIDSNVTITEKRGGKLIERTYKKYELITTHTIRRSAATNLYLSGMDLESIRLLGGWKTIKMLETYLKIDKLDNAKKIASHSFFH